MKMKKKVIPFFVVLAIFGMFGATLVAAYQGGLIGRANDGARAAIENNYYAGWKSAMESGLTQELFQEMQSRHAEMRERRASIDAALEANDFEAWKEAVSANGKGAKMLESVTAEDFPLIREMHEAMESGNFEKVQEIRTELGLPDNGEGGCGGIGSNKGFGKGRQRMTE